LLNSFVAPADTDGPAPRVPGHRFMTTNEEEGLDFGPIVAAALIAVSPSPNHTQIPATAAVATNNAVTVTASPAAHGVPAAPELGERAPDFTYQSRDYQWRNLHNMLEQGDVLLVFGPSDEQLRSLERDQEDLVGKGVLPVAVVGQREGDVWRTVRKLGLTYSLLADPHAAIAEQFGALESLAGPARPMWFVIDQAGRVRGRGEGLSAPRDWVGMAANALGMDGLRSASAH
jgi:peroxiredoxin